MPLVASPMDSKAYDHAVRSARKLKPPSASFGESAFESPKSSSSTGSMNYSPRHSSKPSSLSSSRNISIQRLSLNESPPQQSLLPSSPRRGKGLALSIPPDTSATSPHKSVETPIQERVFDTKASRRSIENKVVPSSGDVILETESQSSIESCPFSRLRSPFKMTQGSPDSLEIENSGARLHQYKANTENETHTDNVKQEHVCNDKLRSSLEKPRSRSNSRPLPEENRDTVAIPEELQEIGHTHAYPQGPANVLNSILYLYSDPAAPDSPLDINDYDLVINVAKECDDLAFTFDDRIGEKKYLRVPWSHNSTISRELPMITREIASMDKPGKKILVHCQCGVSRSACVVVAYFMVKFGISVNEAYELLKSGTNNNAESCSQKLRLEGNFVEACERICPNMSLIFELMDFGDKLQ